MKRKREKIERCNHVRSGGFKEIEVKQRDKERESPKKEKGEHPPTADKMDLGTQDTDCMSMVVLRVFYVVTWLSCRHNHVIGKASAQFIFSAHPGN